MQQYKTNKCNNTKPGEWWYGASNWDNIKSEITISNQEDVKIQS